MSEAKEIERFRFAEPELATLRRCGAAERDQPGLLRMQCQRKLCQPLAHHVEKASAVGLVLEADHDVVRITHDHHVASSLAPSPARRPEIEDVVQCCATIRVRGVFPSRLPRYSAGRRWPEAVKSPIPAPSPARSS